MITKRLDKKAISKAINKLGVCSAVLLGCFNTPVILAQESPSPFLSLSLEDLMQIEVTSISRRSQTLSDTSAAIYVITAADISDSSADTIPDLLRTVPGIEVAQLDANKWAVSARGFNNRLVSKVLVIVDGRQVYSPTFGAVFWESEDLVLENIERIEVTRGAGATIWGANALNGVISITTKSAHETKGTSASLLAGNQNQNIFSFSTGGELGEGASYRFYGKTKQHGGFETLSGLSAEDDWKSRQAGFRIDGQIDSNNSYTLQGDIVDQDINQRLGSLIQQGSIMANVDNPVDYSGGNFIGRWEREDNNGGHLTTQFYYDYRDRDEIIQVEKVKTYDLDVKYTNDSDSPHNLTLGAGIRIIKHDTSDSDFLVHVPEDKTLKLYNISLHDDFRVNEKTILSFGLKAENNIYTGTEFQPNLRLNYALTENQNAWFSISRAVRTPSRGERDGETVLSFIPAAFNPVFPVDVYIAKKANDTYGVEELESIEAGWRWSNGDNLTFDFAAYYNKYDNLRNVTVGLPYCVPDPYCMSQVDYSVQPVILANTDKAETSGLEGVAKWQLRQNVSFEAGYSYFEIDYSAPETLLTNQVESSFQGLTPRRDDPLYKYNLQTNWQISQQMRLNLVYRYVSEPGVAYIDDYHAVDIQYLWEPSDSFSLRLAGRNLGAGSHQEFAEVLYSSVPVSIERSYSIDFRFRW